MANDIRFKVGFDFDASSLNGLKQSLQDIQHMTLTAFKGANPGKQFKDVNTELITVQETARDVQHAMEIAFNPKIKAINLDVFNSALSKSNLNIKEIETQFAKAGQQGALAFRQVAGQVLKSNSEIKKTATILDKVGETFSNTIKWSISSSIINQFSGKVQEAYGYVKSLDRSLNDIRIVTGKSADEMERFAVKANKAAEALGASTTDYTKASLIYYQQGLGEEDVQARTDTTLKVANVTGQSADAVSEQLTAVWNGYKVSAEESELYIDKLSAVAASTASDLEELSTGMSKVASAANSMGVDVDQLNGMLSTIISVTRQAPESAGTALKTIFARMEDLKLDGADSDGVKLGDVSSDLASMGVNIMDAQGNMRDLGEVIEEVGAKWNDGSWSEAEKQALAISLAGKRQYNNLIALFDGWDQYTSAVETSEDAVGTLQRQQDIYMESTEAHLQAAKTAAEDLYDSILDADTVNFFADLSKGVVTFGSNWVDAMGGGAKAIQMLGGIFTTVFSKQIGKTASGVLHNLNSQFAVAKTEILDFKNKLSHTEKTNPIHQMGNQTQDTATQEAAQMQGDFDHYRSYMTEDQVDQAKELKNTRAELLAQKTALEGVKKKAEEYLETLNSTKFDKGFTPESVEDYTSKIEDAEKAFKDLEKTSKKYHKKETKDTKALNEEIQNQIDALNTLKAKSKDGKNLTIDNTIKTLEDVKNKKVDPEKGIAMASKQYKKFAQIQKDQNKTVLENMANVQKGSLDTVNKGIEENKKSWNDFTKDFKTAEAVQGLSQLTGGITQVVAGFQALINIRDIWNNTDLSTGEKALQITQAFVGGVGGVVMGLVAIIGGFSALRVALKKTGKTGAKAWMEILGPVGLAILAITAVIALIGAAIAIFMHFHNANKKAMEDARKEVNELEEAYKKASTEAENLRKQIKSFEDARGALEDCRGDAEKYAEALKKANDAAQELIEKHDLYGEYTWENGEIVINQEALDRIQAEADKKAAGAKQALGIAHKNLNAAEFTYNAEKISRNKTTYEDKDTKETKDAEVSQEVVEGFIKGFAEFKNQKENQELDFKAAFETYLNGRSDLTKAEVEALKHNTDAIISSTKDKLKGDEEDRYYTKQAVQANFSEDTQSKIAEMSKDKDGEIDTNKQKQTSDIVAGIVADTKIDGKTLTQATQEIDVSDVNSTGDLNKRLKQHGVKEIENDEELARRYAVMFGGVSEEDAAGLNYTKGNGVGTLTDNKGNVILKEKNDKQMRKEIARKVQEDALIQKYQGENDATSTKAIDAIKTLNTHADQAEKAAGGVDVTGAVLAALSKGDKEKLDLSSMFADIDPNEIGKFKNLDANGLKDMLGLSEQQIKDLGFASSEDFLKAWKAGLEDYDESGKAFYEKQLALAKEANTQAADLMKGLQSGDIDASNIENDEHFKALQSKLSEIKTDDEELIAAQEILNNTQMAGTQEYTNALELVQDKMAQLEYDELVRKAKTAGEESKAALDKVLSDESPVVTPEADMEEFNKAMDAVMDAEYAIDIAVHAEAEQDFENVIGQMDSIREKAGLIGDDFIVAGQDIRALNNAFPGILDGMEYLADGTIQLNSDVVESAMGMAEAEAKADAKKTIEKLQNQATLLKAKQASYLAMADAANQLSTLEVGNETEAARLKGIISGELANLTAYNDELTTDAELENDATTADSSQANAQVVADNWQKAYQSVASSSADGAKAAIANMNAIANNNAGAVQVGTVGNTFDGGSGGVKKEAKVVEDTKNALNTDNTDYEAVKKNWEKQAKTFEAMAANAGKQANDIEGMIAQIGAQGTGLDKSLDGVRSGAGTDGKKDGEEPEILEHLEEEIDRYHDVNQEIEKVDKSLSKLQKTQEHLTGKDLLNNLNKQLEVLKKQRDVYNDKLNIAKEEADTLKSSLANSGVTFDQDGYVNNYAAALAAKQAYVNAVIDQYNALSAEEQESFKEVVEAAKADYENFKTEMERYEDLVSSEIPDLEEQIEDALYQEIEIQIEKFDMEVQIRLDMSEAERNWNEFKRKIIDGLDDDDLTGKATQGLGDFLSYYNTNNSGTGSVQAQTKHVNDILNELSLMDAGGHSSIYSAFDEETGTWVDDKARAMEDLKEASEGLMSTLEEVEEVENQVHDTFLESIDAVNEAFEARQEAYSFIGDQLDHDMNLMEILYGEKAFDKMNSFYEKQIDNTKKSLAAAQESASYWKKLMDAEQAKGADGDAEALAKYTENWKSAVGEVNGLLEDWADKVTSKYENTINSMMDKLNNAMTNGKGLEYINEELSLLNKNADNYLDKINATYAVQKLSNKWIDAINKTDSVSGQRKLNDLMHEQMDMLERKGELTQYDIDRAEKEYDIALKQIALQDAQQNKSKMKLKRDANGNYSYQFESDQDQIRQAEQELAEAQNSLYNFDKEAYKNNLDKMYATWNEFQEKIAEAYKKYGNDEVKREEAIALIKSQYEEQLTYLAEQNTNTRTNLSASAFDALAEMYGTDVSNFENMSTDEQNILMNELVPQWDSGVQAMIDKFNGEGGFGPVCEETFGDLDEAAGEYQSALDDIGEAAEDNSETIYDEGQELLELTEEQIEAAEEECERVEDILEQVRLLKEEYLAAKQAAIDASKAAYAYQQQKKKEEADANKGSSGNGTEGSNGDNNSNNNGSNDGGAGESDGGSGGEPQQGEKVRLKSGAQLAREAGKAVSITPAEKYRNGSRDIYIQKILSKGASPIHLGTDPNGYNDRSTYIGWVDKSQLEGYDTGGYTGDWGSDGRLALLHQKELVLNKEDTEKMLEAVSLARQAAEKFQHKDIDLTLSSVRDLADRFRREDANAFVSALDQAEYATQKMQDYSLDGMYQAMSNMEDLAERLQMEAFDRTEILTNELQSALEGARMERSDFPDFNQNVHIDATFEGKTAADEIQAALDNLINVATQKTNLSRRF